jgi:hypothetical protein
MLSKGKRRKSFQAKKILKEELRERMKKGLEKNMLKNLKSIHLYWFHLMAQSIEVKKEPKILEN